MYGVTAIDAPEDLTDAGVIYVKAPGNYYIKQDVPVVQTTITIIHAPTSMGWWYTFAVTHLLSRP